MSSAKDTDIAWLAGFLEGEGSFALSKNGNSWHPSVQFYVTNEDMVKKATRIISEIVGRRMRYEWKTTGGYRPAAGTRVGAGDELRILLNALLPYLSGKTRNAEVLLEALNERPGQGARNFDYSRFNALAEELGALNKRYPRYEWAKQQEAKRLGA